MDFDGDIYRCEFTTSSQECAQGHSKIVAGRAADQSVCHPASMHGLARAHTRVLFVLVWSIYGIARHLSRLQAPRKRACVARPHPTSVCCTLTPDRKVDSVDICALRNAVEHGGPKW